MRLARAILFFASALLLGGQQDSSDNGPTSLLIFYKCYPNQRVQLSQTMHSAVQRFEQLRVNGVLAGYRVLFSRYVDTDNWDALAVLNFLNYEAVAKWRQVERNTPAGLATDALASVAEVHSYPVDEVRQKGSSEAFPHPVYLVATYANSMADYRQYLDATVVPQFDGWIQEGILARYEVFLQRYPIGRPWDSAVILAYNDDAAFGQRERIMDRVVQKLGMPPFGEGASNSRAAKGAVIADEITLPR